MNERFYPISKDYFQEHIHPYLLEFKDGRGRPPLISDYDFFVRFYLLCAREFHGEIYQIVMVPGIQSILVLSAGVNQDGFGNCYNRFYLD